MRVHELLSKSQQHETLVSVHSDDDVIELARALSEGEVGFAIVDLKSEGASGVVSERDIIHGLARYGSDIVEKSVEDLMQPNFRYCLKDDLLKYAETIMVQEGIRHLPVAEGDRIIGVISLRDVLEASEC